MNTEAEAAAAFSCEKYGVPLPLGYDCETRCSLKTTCALRASARPPKEKVCQCKAKVVRPWKVRLIPLLQKPH